MEAEVCLIQRRPPGELACPGRPLARADEHPTASQLLSAAKTIATMRPVASRPQAKIAASVRERAYVRSSNRGLLAFEWEHRESGAEEVSFAMSRRGAGHAWSNGTGFSTTVDHGAFGSPPSSPTSSDYATSRTARRRNLMSAARESVRPAGSRSSREAEARICTRDAPPPGGRPNTDPGDHATPARCRRAGVPGWPRLSAST